MIVLKHLRDGFFAKTLDCGGIAVRSAAVVDNDALVLACGKIRLMLQNLPDAQHRMAKSGAELHIIGEFQGTADLPENNVLLKSNAVNFNDAHDKYDAINARARGLGGLMSSCGEENLLNLPGDRYWDNSDICIHEFAHDIMNNGLSNKQFSAIEKQYRAAMHGGLWRGQYAATNSAEYWAELSMRYFDTSQDFASSSHAIQGRRLCGAYDPDGFALLESIYGSLGK